MSSNSSNERLNEEAELTGGNAARGSKRLRTDTSAGGVEMQVEMDKGFWYDDGSVVVVARSVGFKIYKGVLSDHSPVFSDMFSLPQPTAPPADEQLNGCPVVHLEDSPEDLRHILRAALPRKLTLSTPINVDNGAAVSHPSFHVISAYVRLGHKYQMDDLLAHALDYLKAHYTTDFDRWWLTVAVQSYPPNFSETDVIGVINLARLTGCMSILPTAFSACCTLPPATLLAGFKREDGTVEKLSDADVVRCVEGRVTIMETSAAGLLRVFSTPCINACEYLEGQCQKRILRKIMKSLGQVPPRVADSDPFQFSHWQDFWDCQREKCGVCVECWDVLKGLFLEERRAMWEQLPQCFDVVVEGW